MSRAGIAFLILSGWCALSVVFIFGVLLAAPLFNNQFNLNLLVASSSQNVFSSENNLAATGGRSENILAIIKGGDSREVLVDRFLAKYNSPMAGLGKEFVAAADQNGLDWRLLPAIAFQESNLGKKIPRGSYNPFGWAIYEGKNSGAYFGSWPEAISVVATRIRQNYATAGLISPETIVVRYTARQSPTWVFAVQSAMADISPTAD